MVEINEEILEIPIIINKEKKLVKIKKLTAGKKREITKKFIRAGALNTQVNAEITDLIGYQIAVLSNVIIEAPFDYTEEGLENLPEDVVDYLFSKYNEWTSKKKLNQEN